MSHLQVQIAKTAIEHMLGKKHFDICAIDKVGKLLRLRPEGLAYDMLSALHCVDYADMPVDVRTAIPGLIRDAFGGEQFGGALRTIPGGAT